jgi:hypothetical protein
VLGILRRSDALRAARLNDFGSFYPALIFYCALYVPTLALGNSFSLHHLENPKTDFPRVKMLSAVGWIAGLATLNFLKARSHPFQFYLAGGASIVFGFFSLALPHTPPMKTGADVKISEILGLDALALLKKPIIRHLHPVHVPDLHPALLLLRESRHLPHRIEVG